MMRFVLFVSRYSLYEVKGGDDDNRAVKQARRDRYRGFGLVS